jgi:hypothetical protein
MEHAAMRNGLRIAAHPHLPDLQNNNWVLRVLGRINLKGELCFMKHGFHIDTLLPMNLVALVRETEEDNFTKQKELLLVAFEQKLRHFTKEQLLAIQSYMKTYIEIEPSSTHAVYSTNIKLINLYLKKAF